MDFLHIWDRIKNETDIQTLTGLAAFLGTTQQHVSKKKGINEFSVQWAFKIAHKYDLSTDWIMTGKGQKKRDKPDSSYQNDILHEVDRWLTEVIKNEPYRKEWFLGVFLDSFPKFAQWRNNQNSIKNKDNTPRNSKAA
jgi:hypothetical protein